MRKDEEDEEEEERKEEEDEITNMSKKIRRDGDLQSVTMIRSEKVLCNVT